MRLKNNIISDESGGVLILIALMFTVLMSVLGISVDIGRTYAVQAKMQNACDTALLGAVATAGTTNVQAETTRLFNANYPANYMGSSINSVTVTQPSTGNYTCTVSGQFPTAIMQLFGANSISVGTVSHVSGGFTPGGPQSLELAVVLDATIQKKDLQDAMDALRDAIFPDNNPVSNISINIIPYDVAVNLGMDKSTWIQAAWLASYNSYHASSGGSNYYISNRNSDNPPNALNDNDDSAPTTDNLRFRVPHAYNNGGGGDHLKGKKLAPMGFGANRKSDIDSISANFSQDNANQRTNVGLMWGWFSLSPNWQGLWSASFPGLPKNYGSLNYKQLVFVVGAQNNVYTGAGGTSNDDTTTAAICQSIKNPGITIYTVGYGNASNYNATLLQNCASTPAYFYTASNSNQLQAVFQTIVNNAKSKTIYLSQ